MNVNVPPVIAYALPSSFDQEQLSPAVEGIKTNALVYGEAARGFLESADLAKFIDTAKAVAAELKGPDGRLNDWTLPYNLTPLHIACLAQDTELLSAALNDNRCQVDQCTVALKKDGLAVSVDDKQISAMNHDPALHFALFTGWNEGALLLIDRLESQGKLEHTVNNTGNSVLNLAASKCSREVVDSLCTHFRNSESEDYESYLFHKTDNQSSLLHHAAQQDDPAVLKYLENQQGLFGNITRYDQDKGGKTPVDLIKEKVGEKYVQQLETDEALRDSKWVNGFNNQWEQYYMEECLGDTRSWIPPWKQCVIV